MKSKSVAYMLWLFSGFGWLGFHRFYLGKIGTGLLWMISGGVFGIGALIDLFTLGGQVDQHNTKRELKTIRATTLANAQHFAGNQQPAQVQDYSEAQTFDQKFDANKKTALVVIAALLVAGVGYGIFSDSDAPKSSALTEEASATTAGGAVADETPVAETTNRQADETDPAQQPETAAEVPEGEEPTNPEAQLDAASKTNEEANTPEAQLAASQLTAEESVTPEAQVADAPRTPALVAAKKPAMLPAASASTPAANWPTGHRQHTGQVDNSAVTYAIDWQDNGELSGTYYYNQSPGAIHRLTGAANAAGELRLLEMTRGKQSARCVLQRQNDGYVGIMSSTDGRQIPMSLN